jgi:uncharacterized protein (DUF2344 family)
MLLFPGGLLEQGTQVLMDLAVEATTGFEPVIRVLQTLALPLGHVAIGMELRAEERVSVQRFRQRLLIGLQSAIPVPCFPF